MAGWQAIFAKIVFDKTTWVFIARSWPMELPNESNRLSTQVPFLITLIGRCVVIEHW